MQHRDKICLMKIIEEIDIAKELIGESSEEEFLCDEMMKRAVSMTVINIGELIKNVSEELRQNHREVPWKAAAGLRDITAHHYQTLRMESVYMTATQDFIKLRRQLEQILAEDEELL